MNQAYRQYQTSQAQTASPAQLIVLMYNGAIRFLTVARQKLDAGEIEATHNSMLRAQDIILELMISVDVGTAPVAQNLFDLYEFMHRHLVEANVRKDGQAIDDVIDLLRDLLGAWEQAIAADKKTTITRAVAVA